MKKHNKVKFSLYIANDDWFSKLECDKETLFLGVGNARLISGGILFFIIDKFSDKCYYEHRKR